MDWIAAPTTHEAEATYSGPQALANRYRRLDVRAAAQAGRGFDIERAYAASFQAGKTAPTWTPLDGQEELTLLRATLRLARQDLTREHPTVAARWWRVWWALRVEGAPASSRPTGYSRQHADRVREAVDYFVEGAMVWHDLLAETYEDPPRERVWVNNAAFTEEGDDDR